MWRGPVRPLDAGEATEGVLRILRSHGHVLVLLSALIVVPVRLAGWVADRAIVADLDLGRVGPIGAGGGALLFAVSVLGIAVAGAAAVQAAGEAYLGGTPSVSHALRFVIRRIIRVGWLGVVAGASLVAVALAPVGVAVLLADLDVDVVGVELAATIGLVVAGGFAVSWSVALPVLFVEGFGGREALRRSRRIVALRYRRAAAMLGVCAAGAVALAGIAGLALAGGVPTEGTQLTIAGFAAGTVAMLLAVPALAAVVVVTYVDASARHRGTDPQVLALGLGCPGVVAPQRPGATDGSDPWDPWRPLRQVDRRGSLEQRRSGSKGAWETLNGP